MNKTNEYYKNNLHNFVENTKNADMSNLYNFFEKYLQVGDTVLDLGFGSGRDSLYFSNKYKTYSIDPVKGFVDLGKSLGLKNVYQMSAEDMNFDNMFDGIWACSSLLHVLPNNLNFVFKNCELSLNKNGVIYVSFKYGNFCGVRNGRYFIDLTEESINQYLVGTDLKIAEYMITEDVRPDRNEKWLNVILKK